MPFGANGGPEQYAGLAALGVITTAVGLLARRFLSGVEKQKDNLLTPCYEQLDARTRELEHERRVIERLRILCRVHGVEIPDDLWRD